MKNKNKLSKFKVIIFIIFISLSFFYLGILSSDYPIAQLPAYFFGSILLGLFVGSFIGYLIKRKKDEIIQS